jgi:hypothetical protein
VENQANTNADNANMWNKWADEKSRRDGSGKRWNFSYWYSGALEEKSRQAQRLAFWDDSKDDCGVILFPPGAAVPYSRIRDLIGKLVAHESVRKQYRRELNFPLEQHYPEFGAFPEERSS